MTRQPTPSGSRMRAKPAYIPLALLLAVMLLAGCAQTGQMVYMPRYDVYEPADELFGGGTSARTFPEGAVPYVEGDVSANDPAVTGRGDAGVVLSAIPVEVTTDLVARGKERYDIYCVPCHGPTGESDGMAVTIGRFPAPPKLAESTASPGVMFDVITHGRGNMFPYGYRVKPADRWAVIAYVRALKLKNGAVTPKDLTADELNQLGGQR